MTEGINCDRMSHEGGPQNPATEQLVSSERLMSLGRLAAGVAHEINNPIGYVLANLRTLERYLSALLNAISLFERAPASASQLAEIERIAQASARVSLATIRDDLPDLMGQTMEGLSRVRKIVQDLKDFSRVDDDAPWVLSDLNQRIEAALALTSSELKYRAVVRTELNPLPLVRCLPAEIEQVLINLLINAGHSVEPGKGEIRVSSGAYEGIVCIEVSDNGHGMTKEVMKRIFEPFFTTKAIGEGTGLGLSIAYGIVQKHGGYLLVDSLVGQGARFRLALPAAAPEQRA
jgi:two-component system NtrC family sensor kinase